MPSCQALGALGGVTNLSLSPACVPWPVRLGPCLTMTDPSFSLTHTLIISGLLCYSACCLGELRVEFVNSCYSVWFLPSWLKQQCLLLSTNNLVFYNLEYCVCPCSCTEYAYKVHISVCIWYMPLYYFIGRLCPKRFAHMPFFVCLCCCYFN